MSDIRSSLSFDGYYIEEFTFKRNQNVDLGDFELDFSFEAKSSISEEDNEALISLTCYIFDEDYIEKELPFFIKTTFVGNFRTENVKIEDFQIHGMAILLPFLRAFITSSTAQAGIEPIIIPPINVHKHFKEAEE